MEKTDISLKEYVDVRFRAIETSTDLARQNVEIRLNGMNEWRHIVEDQSNKFVTRKEFEDIKRLVYMGLGIAVALEVLLKFFVH